MCHNCFHLIGVIMGKIQIRPVLVQGYEITIQGWQVEFKPVGMNIMLS